MTHTVYVSGAITGLDQKEAYDLFEKGEKDAREVFNKIGGGVLEIINPLNEVNQIEGKTWENYMREDIMLLMRCNSIFMLRNWVGSRGAVLEHTIAKALGFVIFYQK